MRFISVLLLLATLGWGGCQQKPPVAPPDTYEVRGVVRSVEPGKKTIVIKHEAVTNYMVAMTMPFDVRDTNELAGVKSGDAVLFRLNVTEKDGWVDRIRVLSNSPVAADSWAPESPVRFVTSTPVLKVGDPLPDYSFTNEFGKTVKFSDYRGQAVAFTFIFTRCPFPNFCPRMTDNLSQALKQLRQRTDAPTNFHLLSISFDPKYDTSETLLKYGERFNYDPIKWSLVTTDFDQLERLTGHFELQFVKNVPIEQQNHNLRTVVIDTQGKVAGLFPSNDWEVGDLVESIVRAAQVK
ncbi:MAG TPA: SCO family protein [Candidatus Limnocylindria bacterium]|jgi:protein SCO1/2|nr:SCO family protein [Candidatus Limnocylindria bacterium]